MKNTPESGRSMIEMLGVLAIIAVMTVGGINATISMNSYFKVQAIVPQIDKAAQDIKDLFSWYSNYDGISMPYLCYEDVFECTNSAYTNSWGGVVDVGDHPPEDDDGKFYFTISYQNVPKSACEQICFLGIDKAFKNVSVYINKVNFNDYSCDPYNKDYALDVKCYDTNEMIFVGY